MCETAGNAMPDTKLSHPFRSVRELEHRAGGSNGVSFTPNDKEESNSGSKDGFSVTSFDSKKETDHQRSVESPNWTFDAPSPFTSPGVLQVLKKY